MYSKNCSPDTTMMYSDRYIVEPAIFCKDIEKMSFRYWVV